MPYPEELGPDPELSRREHFARFRERISHFLFRRREAKRPVLVEAYDFTHTSPDSDEYFRVHHERYLSPRVFLNGSLLPMSAGGVSIIVRPETPSSTGEADFFVTAAYPAPENGEGLSRDFVVLRRVAEATPEGDSFIVLDESERAEEPFYSLTELPAGSETIMLERTTLADLIETLEPEDIMRPDDGVYIRSLQLQLEQILKVIGYPS